MVGCRTSKEQRQLDLSVASMMEMDIKPERCPTVGVKTGRVREQREAKNSTAVDISTLKSKIVGEKGSKMNASGKVAATDVVYVSWQLTGTER